MTERPRTIIRSLITNSSLGLLIEGLCHLCRGWHKYMCLVSSSSVTPDRAILAEVTPVQLPRWVTLPVGTPVTTIQSCSHCIGCILGKNSGDILEISQY